MDDAWEIGQRARMIRRRRGMSLNTAAGLAGISKPYLSQLENGKRSFDRRSLLENVASALSCSVADLTGQPYPIQDAETRQTAGFLPVIRTALHDYGADEVPDVSPRPIAQLTPLAERANEHCGQAQYHLAGKDIGAILTELQVHALTARAADRTIAVRGFVNACFAAGVVASRMGSVDLAAVAAQRGYDIALEHDDPGLLGFARWYWSLELTSAGARSRARTALTNGIDELTGVALSDSDTFPAEMLGSMHLQQARASARLNDPDDAHAHLREAADLATQVGERNGMDQHFGPTNVAIWRLAIGIELSEGGAAYETAISSAINSEALHSRERSASFQLDLARAAAQESGNRDAVAVRHLDAADRIAPQRVRSDPIARDLVSVLSRRTKRRSWELDSLRNRFGVG